MKKNATYIIAEAGVNHNGSLKLAKKLVSIASSAGADAVKFQYYRTENIITKNAKTANYQSKNTGETNQYQLLKKLELTEENLRNIKKFCKTKKIEFLCSAFDITDLRILLKLGIKKIKIASGEITNLPYLRFISSLKKKIILSTGMATMSEIKKAIKILISGGVKKHQISLLHCTSDYPASVNEANLLAINSMNSFFNLDCGYSDHTEGTEVSIAAVALGAKIIEKHFTISKSMTGPDHKASLNPAELAFMIKAIRNIEQALGNGTKLPTKNEKKNIALVRKSVVAKQTINKGQIFSNNNICAKRPGNGMSPMSWDKIIGNKAKKKFLKDEKIYL